MQKIILDIHSKLALSSFLIYVLLLVLFVLMFFLLGFNGINIMLLVFLLLNSYFIHTNSYRLVLYFFFSYISRVHAILLSLSSSQFESVLLIICVLELLFYLIGLSIYDYKQLQLIRKDRNVEAYSWGYIWPRLLYSLTISSGIFGTNDI